MCFKAHHSYYHHKIKTRLHLFGLKSVTTVPVSTEQALPDHMQLQYVKVCMCACVYEVGCVMIDILKNQALLHAMCAMNICLV